MDSAITFLIDCSSAASTPATIYSIATTATAASAATAATTTPTIVLLLLADVSLASIAAVRASLITVLNIIRDAASVLIMPTTRTDRRPVCNEHTVRFNERLRKFIEIVVARVTIFQIA